MQLVVQAKLMPDAAQASAPASTLRTLNEAANRVSAVAFDLGVPREYELRKHTYADLRAQGLGAQAAQHTIKKVRDAYTTLAANIRAGHLGTPGSKRRRNAESAPIAFRPEAAPPLRRPVSELAVRPADGVHLDHRGPVEERGFRLRTGGPQDADRAPAGRIRSGRTRRRVLPDGHLRGARGTTV
ncbi:hypothetical protein [Streptomonospora litoralis]|uniref:hypothetical protein n=1 Tax=Streptomonospora litoralis TaxID=2498135 RepID=UPI003101319E